MGDYICMENNFLSLIKTRRSVRAYKSEPVPSEALDAVLEAGTYPAQEAGQPAARKQKLTGDNKELLIIFSRTQLPSSTKVLAEPSAKTRITTGAP